MKYLLFVLLSLIALESCLDGPLKEERNPPSEGAPLAGSYFTSDKIGWTITLPKGNKWKLIPIKEQRKINKDGKQMVEELTGNEIESQKNQFLISFRKDLFNSFISHLQPFNDSVDGEYDDMLTAMHTLIKNNYKAKDIPADYELSATRIDGVMVDKFDIDLSMPGKGRLYQHIYTCLIKDHLLVMTITTDNKKDDETLLGVAFSSKFAFKK